MPKFENFNKHYEAYNQASDERTKLWRRVFSTDDGREVLIELLGELHILSTEAPTPEVIIRENVGKWILAELGIMQPGQERAIVDSLLRINPRPSMATDNFQE